MSGEELGRALVFPNPKSPDEDYIYRIRFKEAHEEGPHIDFKYRGGLPEEILQEDPRQFPIIRVSQLTKIIRMTTWFDDEDIELPYVKIAK